MRLRWQRPTAVDLFDLHVRPFTPPATWDDATVADVLRRMVLHPSVFTPGERDRLMLEAARRIDRGKHD